MKATTLLERQHRNLQQLCEAVERGSDSVRASLLPQLAGDLVAHLAVEESIFHPAASDTLREDTWRRFGEGRHQQARHALDRALATPVETSDFTAVMAELRAIVELHAEEQEELLFPRLEAVLDASRMRRLGLAILELYHAKVEAGYPPVHGGAAHQHARAP